MAMQVKEGFWSEKNYSAVGKYSVIPVSYRCSEDAFYQESHKKTSICVNSDECTWDPGCLENGGQRLLGDKWCCSKDQSCLKGTIGPMCLSCDN